MDRDHRNAAIMIYVAEKHGRFLSRDLGARVRYLEWLMFQAADPGPMFGQAGTS